MNRPGESGDPILLMDPSSQRMLADAALVLWACERLAGVDALTVDLGAKAAAGLRRWLDEVHPEAAAALARLSRT